MSTANHQSARIGLSRTNLMLVAACLTLWGATAAHAHDDYCAAIVGSVADTGLEDRLTATCSDTYATIQSDTYPYNGSMTGVAGMNEQVSVPTDYTAPIIPAPALGKYATDP